MQWVARLQQRKLLVPRPTISCLQVASRVHRAAHSLSHRVQEQSSYKQKYHRHACRNQQRDRLQRAPGSSILIAVARRCDSGGISSNKHLRQAYRHLLVHCKFGATLARPWAQIRHSLTKLPLWHWRTWRFEVRGVPRYCLDQQTVQDRRNSKRSVHHHLAVIGSLIAWLHRVRVPHYTFASSKRGHSIQSAGSRHIHLPERTPAHAGSWSLVRTPTLIQILLGTCARLETARCREAPAPHRTMRTQWQLNSRLW